MVGVIIIIVVFDAQAAGRAARRAIIGPDRAKARFIAATYSAARVQDATIAQSDDSREALGRAQIIMKGRNGPVGPESKKRPRRTTLFASKSPEREIGAGEEIRTLDPNHGKVVLYQ